MAEKDERCELIMPVHLDLGLAPEQNDEPEGGDARSIASQNAISDDRQGDGGGRGTHLEESGRNSRTDEGGHDSSSQTNRAQQNPSNQTCPFAALQAALEAKKDAPSKSSATLMCPVSGRGFHSESFKFDVHKGNRAFSNIKPSVRSGTSRFTGSVLSKGSSSKVGGRNVKRRIAGWKRTKPPPYQQTDVDKYATTIKATWNTVLETLAWDDIGHAIYTNLFEIEPSLEGMFTHDRRVMGSRWLDKFSSLILECDNPPAIHESLEMIAPFHIRVGLKPEYMAYMGQGVFKMVREAIGSAWTSFAIEAWSWLWAWMSESMTLQLLSAGSSSSLIQMSWEMTCDSYEDERGKVDGGQALGEALYDALIELAPNIRNVISTPRQMIAIKFVEMVNHIVAFSEDPARMRDQMPAIAARHIAYGVQRHHANIMGQVLTTVLGEAMEDEWTEEIQEAWSSNWDAMCSALFTEMNNWEAFAAPAAALWSRLRRKWTPAVFGQQIAPRINQSLPFLVHEFTAAWKEDRAANGDRSGVDAAAMYAGSGGGVGGGQRGAQKRSSPLASTATPPRKAGVGAGLGGKLARMLSGSSRDNDGPSPHQQGAWLTNTRKNSNSIDEHVHFVSSPGHSTAIPTLNSSVCEDGRASLDGRMSHSADDMPSSSKNTRSPPLRKGLLFDLHSPPDMSPMGLPSSLASSRGSPLASRAHGKGGVATGVATVDKKSVRRHSMLKTSATDEERLAQDAADAFGQEIWQVMNIATDLLWEPDARNERMISTATRLFHFGVRITHLPTLGRVICESLKSALASPCGECGLHEWSKDQTLAWNWMWGQLINSMEPTLVYLEGGQVDVVKESWEVIKQSWTSEELGELFYLNLSREAPYLVHLFQRPKKMQAYLFMQAIDLIVQFGEEPELFFHQLKPLVIRHIKYGVKTEYMRPFGSAILHGTEEALGGGASASDVMDGINGWTPEVATAWRALWSRCSSCVSRSLNAGTNLITVSLVQGDIQGMRTAIACAPRRSRTEWFTQVEVNGEVLSPLYWAIRDGKFSIAQFMLEDLLSIRADREEYYYGKTDLFDTHPDIVEVLCREAPDLFDVLLDGLVWHSQTVEEGQLRVNYYIAELVCDPKGLSGEDAYRQPISVMALEGRPNMFRHPVVEQIISIKWQRMRRFFLSLHAIFALLVILHSIAFVANGRSCESQFVAMRWVVFVFSIIIFAAYAAVVKAQWRSQKVVDVSLLARWNVRLPRVLTVQWNIARIGGVVLIIISSIASGTQPCIAGGGSVWISHIRAWAAFVLWAQLTQLLMISTRLAALLYTVGQLFSDVFRLLILTGIVLLAFATYLTCLQEGPFLEFFNSALVLIRVILDLDWPELDMLGFWAMFMLVGFMVVVKIGLLSILIAQLSLSYEHLSEDKVGYARMGRAFLCVEMESFLPLAWRKAIYDELGFQNPLEFDSGDVGPCCGGVQVLENASVRMHAKYVPDRIIRYSGSTLPTDPWPLEHDGAHGIAGEDDKMSRL